MLLRINFYRDQLRSFVWKEGLKSIQIKVSHQSESSCNHEFVDDNTSYSIEQQVVKS